MFKIVLLCAIVATASAGTCKTTTCKYTSDGHTHVYSKRLNNDGTANADHERWHCQKSGRSGCACTCADALKCTLTHHHTSGYKRSFDHCGPKKAKGIDGIPLSEFKNWKCWRGYPGYAWKSRHHVHTIAMSGEVGSRSSGDQTKTIKNTDTHGHDHKKAGALEDDTLDGCIEHALHHHFAGLTTQGVTFACHGGSEGWTTIGYKRCEVHTVEKGDSMTTPYGKDHANMGKSGSSSHNYGMILKGRASHVTCLRNEDVHDHWGSRYDSAYEMTLQAARNEYVNCRRNGRTDSGKTHKEHSAHHYDSKGNHLRR
jgi:hypothetical protein